MFNGTRSVSLHVVQKVDSTRMNFRNLAHPLGIAITVACNHVCFSLDLTTNGGDCFQYY
jgi:hypothetical protein